MLKKCRIEWTNYSLIIILSLPYNLAFDKNIQQFMPSLISLTENIRKNLDEGNIGCGIFVNLQRAFNTVEYDILLSKLEH